MGTKIEMDEINISTNILEDPYKFLGPKRTEEFKSVGDQLPFSGERCIYSVPWHLHRINEDAYTPQLVYIRPLHRSKEFLKRMEKYKLKSVEKFLQRARQRKSKEQQRKGSSSGPRLEDFVRYIKEKEQSIRRRYAETLHYSSKEFVKMILRDVAFIIERFLVESFPIKMDDYAATFIKISMFGTLSQPTY